LADLLKKLNRLQKIALLLLLIALVASISVAVMNKQPNLGAFIARTVIIEAAIFFSMNRFIGRQ